MLFASAKRFREWHSSANKLALCLVLVACAEPVWLADLAVICPKQTKNPTKNPKPKQQEEEEGSSHKITKWGSHAVCYSFLGITVHLDLYGLYQEQSQAVIRLQDKSWSGCSYPAPAELKIWVCSALLEGLAYSFLTKWTFSTARYSATCKVLNLRRWCLSSCQNVSDTSTVSSDDLTDTLIFPACSGSFLCPLSYFKPPLCRHWHLHGSQHGHMVKLLIEPAVYNISPLSNFNYFPAFLLSCNVP